MRKPLRFLYAPLLLCLLCALFPLRASARDTDYECAMFPAGTLEVSQIAYGSYSHADTLATDILPGGDVFAPFTARIVMTDSDYGCVVLQSTDKVHWADGSLDYMSVSFLHDNDTTDLKLGQVIEQGTPFYQAGVRTPGGYITAPHVHIVIIRGKAEDLSNPFRGTDYIFDAFFLDTDTEVLIEGWTAETRYCLRHHAPTDYSGLWTSIDSFGSYRIRYDPDGGSGEIPGRFKTGGVDFVLSSGAAFTRAGYRFIGWSEQSGSCEAQFAPGAVFSEDRPLTLYAVWEPLPYRVDFDGRDGETVSTGGSVALPGAADPRPGYRFCGWRLTRDDGLWYSAGGWTEAADDAALFAPGSLAALGEDWAADYGGEGFSFRAVREPVSYTVRFEPGVFNPFGLLVRGETPDQQHIYGEAQTLATCGFVRRGWHCTGWSTEKNGGDFFPLGQPVQNLCAEDGGLVTLYARWEQD